jgi:plasmid stabilization system protein ParE
MTPLVSPQARLDLLEIWEFIARDDIDAADQVITEIEHAFMALADHPRIGHVREDLAPRDLRFWPVHSYLVVYRWEVQPIEIARVLSHWRDLVDLLP